MIEAAEMLGWIDPLTLGFVGLGSVAIAAIRARKGEVAASFVALKPLLLANPAADAEAAMRAVRRVEAIAEAKSVHCADRVGHAGPFLREAVARLSDARSAGAFTGWAKDTLQARKLRHEGVIAFWGTLADTAPAMGMIATVLGLVRMFSHLEDPRLIGPPMASALVATLLGLVIANVIAGPIAARLERLHEDEAAWQSEALDHLSALARTELESAEALQRRLRQQYGG